MAVVEEMPTLKALALDIRQMMHNPKWEDVLREVPSDELTELATILWFGLGEELKLPEGVLAGKAEKPKEEPNKKHKQESWTALETTGPAHTGKKKADVEDQPDPVIEESAATGTKEKGPPPPGGKKKEGAFLRVRKGTGAGVVLEATCWGMCVDFIEPKPGQPDLVPGCTITSIDGISLVGLSNEDEVYDAFERGFRYDGNIPIEVDQVAFEIVELPPEASNWPPLFTEALNSLANKFGIEQNITRMGIELRGPNIAMPEAKSELQLLLNFYKEEQKKEQQQQAEIDAEATRRMVEEQKKREAEEWAAWEQAVNAWQAEQMAMMAAYVQEVQQQQMEAYAAQHHFQQQHLMQQQHYQQQQAQHFYQQPLPQQQQQHFLPPPPQHQPQQPFYPPGPRLQAAPNQLQPPPQQQQQHYQQQQQQPILSPEQMQLQMQFPDNPVRADEEWVLQYDQYGYPYFYHVPSGNSSQQPPPRGYGQQGYAQPVYGVPIRTPDMGQQACYGQQQQQPQQRFGCGQQGYGQQGQPQSMYGQEMGGQPYGGYQQYPPY